MEIEIGVAELGQQFDERQAAVLPHLMKQKAISVEYVHSYPFLFPMRFVYTWFYIYFRSLIVLYICWIFPFPTYILQLENQFLGHFRKQSCFKSSKRVIAQFWNE
jgi:hypothetical protein